MPPNGDNDDGLSEGDTIVDQRRGDSGGKVVCVLLLCCYCSVDDYITTSTYFARWFEAIVLLCKFLLFSIVGILPPPEKVITVTIR